MAGLFQVLWGNADGTFKKATTLNGTDNEPLIIPVADGDRDAWIDNICTRPTAVDWDADGDLDLVVGNFPGSFYIFTGEGKGRFLPKAQVIMSGNSPLKIDGAHSDPFIVDWDKDGDIDLLSGSSNGGVHWAENVAGPGKPPVLNSFRTLIEKRPPVEYGQPLSEEQLSGPVSATRIWIDDVNSDGKFDVLVGDNVTLISVAKGITNEEFNKKHAAWQKELQAVLSELNSSANDETKRQKVMQRYEELQKKRADFMSEERTGFVWLYLQK